MTDHDGRVAVDEYDHHEMLHREPTAQNASYTHALYRHIIFNAPSYPIPAMPIYIYIADGDDDDPGVRDMAINVPKSATLRQLIVG